MMQQQNSHAFRPFLQLTLLVAPFIIVAVFSWWLENDDRPTELPPEEALNLVEETSGEIGILKNPTRTADYEKVGTIFLRLHETYPKQALCDRNQSGRFHSRLYRAILFPRGKHIHERPITSNICKGTKPDSSSDRAFAVTYATFRSGG